MPCRTGDGLCTDEQYDTFHGLEFERRCASCIVLVKYLLVRSPIYRAALVKLHATDPLGSGSRPWTLSRAADGNYTKAKETMLERTHIPEAPCGSRRVDKNAPPELHRSSP